MSESDDSDILADIQALDEALALSVKEKSQQYASSDQRSDVLSDVEDSENNDECFDYLCTNRYIDESLNAYEINTKLIMGLTIAKKKLTALLEECEQKIKLLDEKITKSRDESSLNPKLAISNAGMPYFKNKDYFGAPKNYDTKLKEARGELFLHSLKKPSRWSAKDRETLLGAINNQAIESVLCGEFSKEIDESVSDDQAKKTKLVLPRNFNEMVGAFGEREFDWHKISVMDFENKHSPGECQAMWNVYLHPDFRKNEWTSAEDNDLLKCVKKYKCQDWDAITRKLGTNRSAYQCFIRYNTIKKVPSAGRRWTRQENRHLIKIVNTLRIGDYIPWTELANHMRYRTKQQIYVRWMYRTAPYLTKGRFTSAETSTLLKAMQKYGTNFTKISNAVMPHRTSIQLQQRYLTVINNAENLWTVDDDVTLINLHTKYRNKWSKIATYFSNKSRTQVRHRYTALLKYVQKGVSLENIPRPPPSMRNRKLIINKKSSSSSASNKRNKTTLHIKRTQHAVYIFDIQLRLYETLCFPPSIKSNISEEPYDIEQLAHDTKKLYNTLNLLNANLDIPTDFLKYVQLNKKEKQLLVSLKEYVSINNRMQNNGLIEKFRTRMFGYTPEVSESDFFIPPLPFDGHVRTKKIKNRKITISIDYNSDVTEKFLVDLPTDFSGTYIFPLVSVEEEIQFYKFGQFLTSDYHNFNQQNVDLYKSSNCISFDKKTLSEYNKLNMNSTNLKNYEQLNEVKETISTDEDDEETNMNNIILPNQATLLGLKNLLLWKLLYDYEEESRQQCELMAFRNERKSRSLRNPKKTVTNFPVQTESAQYQLLRTRLLQLFKLPISLSNTILQVQGPDQIFSNKEIHQDVDLTGSKKRKLEDTKVVQLNKKDSSNVSTNGSQLNSDDTTQNVSAVRSCKMIRKKYKIITK